MPADVLHIDFETCNTLNLKQVGADVYSRSPMLIVTVVAWAWNDDPPKSFTLPKLLPTEVMAHLANGGTLKAWAAGFEAAIIANHYGIPLAPEQIDDTQQAALHSGLPGKLEDAGPAVGAPVHKDMAGHRLMLQMSKPRDASGPTYWHNVQQKLDQLEDYCKRDVESERAVAAMIAPLPPREQAIALIDRRANNRGVRLDIDLVHKLKRIALEETRRLDKESALLTAGAVTSAGTQVARLNAWLTGSGLPLPDLGRETVAWALDTFVVPEDVRRMLEIRQEIAKSSVKKLDAMLRCAGPGSRIRGQLQYYGAPRTGRWAGRLIQPQNFPRPAKADIALFIRMVGTGAPTSFMREIFTPSLMDMIASSLRGCLIPADGHAFVIYALEQIEARVLAWLAGQQDVLDVFARGEDVYTWTQQTLGLPTRQAGKVARLALGFQMGAGRLVETAASYGLTLTTLEAQTYVDAFRNNSSQIVRLWHRLDSAAKTLLALPSGREIPVDRLILATSTARNGTRLLTMRLPSGRRLYYRNARMGTSAKGYATIYYDGVDPDTKQWGTLNTYGGKLAENATQAVARDVLAEGLLAGNHDDLVLTVHDEGIFEVPVADGPFRDREVHAALIVMPAWAAGLPVTAGGGIRMRYGK